MATKTKKAITKAKPAVKKATPKRSPVAKKTIPKRSKDGKNLAGSISTKGKIAPVKSKLAKKTQSPKLKAAVKEVNRTVNVLSKFEGKWYDAMAEERTIEKNLRSLRITDSAYPQITEKYKAAQVARRNAEKNKIEAESVWLDACEELKKISQAE